MTRRRALAEAGVELTPLIDVVFLLLIFFLVSASFIGNNLLDIELPVTGGEPRALASSALVVAVRRDGTYRVGGQAVGGATTEAVVAALSLAQANTEPAPKRLVVVADALASHQTVVRVLEAAAAVGLTRISIMTRPSAAAGENPAGCAGDPMQADSCRGLRPGEQAEHGRDSS